MHHQKSHPSLGYDYIPYFLSEFTLIVMFIRFAYINELIFGLKTYTDIYSNKVCRVYGPKVKKGMYAKICFIDYPMWTALMVMFIVTSILAMILNVFETPYRLKS
jgi:hypothetical protein